MLEGCGAPANGWEEKCLAEIKRQALAMTTGRHHGLKDIHNKMYCYKLLMVLIIFPIYVWP